MAVLLFVNFFCPQDVNSAIQESIGDAIFLAMMTPQHLNRIKLLPDKYLPVNRPSIFTKPILRAIYSHSEQVETDAMVNGLNAQADGFAGDDPTVDGHAYPKLSILNRLQSQSDRSQSKLMREINDFDLVLLLHMALAKIPTIPFQYMMDATRWNLFNGTVAMSDANAFFWNMSIDEQGIHPPDREDRRDFFDLGAKFHTSDNTPYTRYLNDFLPCGNSPVCCIFFTRCTNYNFTGISWPVSYKRKFSKASAKLRFMILCIQIGSCQCHCTDAMSMDQNERENY